MITRTSVGQARRARSNSARPDGSPRPAATYISIAPGLRPAPVGGRSPESCRRSAAPDPNCPGRTPQAGDDARVHAVRRIAAAGLGGPGRPLQIQLLRPRPTVLARSGFRPGGRARGARSRRRAARASARICRSAAREVSMLPRRSCSLASKAAMSLAISVSAEPVGHRQRLLGRPDRLVVPGPVGQGLRVGRGARGSAVRCPARPGPGSAPRWRRPATSTLTSVSAAAAASACSSRARISGSWSAGSWSVDLGPGRPRAPASRPRSRRRRPDGDVDRIELAVSTSGIGDQASHGE